MGDEGLKFAHKFLHGFGRGRGKIAKVAVVKPQILEYSGYLLEGATSDEDGDKIEKFKVYASRVMLPSLRDLCDLFDLDRSAATKEMIVERLAQFLSSPDAKYTKTASKSKKKNLHPKTKNEKHHPRLKKVTKDV